MHKILCNLVNSCGFVNLFYCKQVNDNWYMVHLYTRAEPF